MDPAAIWLEARLAAIEYVIANAFKMIYRIIGVSDEQIERSHEEFRQYLKTMTIPVDDPAIADLVASEMEQAHTRLLTKDCRCREGAEKRNRLAALLSSMVL
jgi:hypothetical protein